MIVTSGGYCTQLQVLCGVAFVVQVVDNAILEADNRKSLFQQFDQLCAFELTNPELDTAFEGTCLITLSVGDVL